MKSWKFKMLVRFTAFFLVPSLISPSPSLALRATNAGNEESNASTGTKRLLVAALTTPTVATSPLPLSVSAGAEEPMWVKGVVGSLDFYDNLISERDVKGMVPETTNVRNLIAAGDPEAVRGALEIMQQALPLDSLEQKHFTLPGLFKTALASALRQLEFGRGLDQRRVEIRQDREAVQAQYEASVQKIQLDYVRKMAAGAVEQLEKYEQQYADIQRAGLPEFLKHLLPPAFDEIRRNLRSANPDVKTAANEIHRFLRQLEAMPVYQVPEVLRQPKNLRDRLIGTTARTASKKDGEFLAYKIKLATALSLAVHQLQVAQQPITAGSEESKDTTRLLVAVLTTPSPVLPAFSIPLSAGAEERVSLEAAAGWGKAVAWLDSVGYPAVILLADYHEIEARENWDPSGAREAMMSLGYKVIPAQQAWVKQSAGAEERVVLKEEGDFQTLAFYPEGKLVSILEQVDRGTPQPSGRVRTFDLPNGRQLRSFDLGSGLFRGLVVHPDGQQVTVLQQMSGIDVRRSGNLQTYTLADGQQVKLIDLGYGTFKGLVMRPERGQVLVLQQLGEEGHWPSGQVRTFDLQTGRQENSLDLGAGTFTALAMHSDGQKVSVLQQLGGRGLQPFGRVHTFNLENGQSVDADFLELGNGTFEGLVVYPGGKRISVVEQQPYTMGGLRADAQVHTYDLATKKKQPSRELSGGQFSGLNSAPDGTELYLFKRTGLLTSVIAYPVSSGAPVVAGTEESIGIDEASIRIAMDILGGVVSTVYKVLNGVKTVVVTDLESDYIHPEYMDEVNSALGEVAVGGRVRLEYGSQSVTIKPPQDWEGEGNSPVTAPTNPKPPVLGTKENLPWKTIESDRAGAEETPEVAVGVEQKGGVTKSLDKYYARPNAIQLLRDVEVRAVLSAQDWVRLTSDQLGAFEIDGVNAGYLIADSAAVTDASHVILSHNQLRNPMAEKKFSWILGGESESQLLNHVKVMRLKKGDLFLTPTNRSLEELEVLLQEKGLWGPDAVRTVIGNSVEVAQLKPYAFQLLASQENLPAVVYLDVVLRLRDEAGRTYTLLLMA